MPRLRWSLCQRAVREKSAQLIYTDVKISTNWWGSKVGPTLETFTKPGRLTAGCITNRDLQALCLWIIHTRSALHISSDVCKRGIVPGAQKLTGVWGSFQSVFARVSLRGKARTAFSCPLLVQPSKCGSKSRAGNHEAAKMAPSIFREFAPGINGKVGQSWWHNKRGVISLIFIFLYSGRCISGWDLWK